MRVIFLTHNYPRAPGDVSGAFLETLATVLVRRGTAVTVIAPSDGGTGGEETRDGVRVRRIRYASPARETLAYRGTMAAVARSPAALRSFLALRHALRVAARAEMRAGADLVHAHWWIPAGLASPRGVPLVITSHGTDAALLARSRVARLVARPVFTRARVVTAVSRQLAAWIHAATGRTLDEAHVQPMPLNTDGYRPGPGGRGAVVVARLTEQKRAHLALEAIAAAGRAGRSIPLTIVGDGPERPRLEALARELGIRAQVTFAGVVRPAEIPGFLAGADLMIFPARAEGFGLVAAEALLCGVPVIACEDGGGVLDVVPRGPGGRIVPPTAESIAAATLELCDSPDARSAAAAAGEKWRERLSPDYVAAACERWYVEALSG